MAGTAAPIAGTAVCIRIAVCLLPSLLPDWLMLPCAAMRTAMPAEHYGQSVHREIVLYLSRP